MTQRTNNPFEHKETVGYIVTVVPWLSGLAALLLSESSAEGEEGDFTQNIPGFHHGVTTRCGSGHSHAICLYMVHLYHPWQHDTTLLHTDNGRLYSGITPEHVSGPCHAICHQCAKVLPEPSFSFSIIYKREPTTIQRGTNASSHLHQAVD